MWPELFELSIGETHVVPTSTGDRKVQLLSLRETTEPDYWSEGNPGRRILNCAYIDVNISGQHAVLVARPFQMPVVVNGVRIYVETTKRWAKECGIQPLNDMSKDVRFSALAEENDWGPPELVFPLKDYRWRSSSYNNTWSAFVPAPDRPFYYHRGEDFGAIPDQLDVLSVTDGVVIGSPLSPEATSLGGQPPSPSSRANCVEVRSVGISITYGHMNTESIDPGVVVGARVHAGQFLGKSGCTWDGWRSMQKDPHLHLEFHRSPEVIPKSILGPTDAFSPYAFLVNAYFRAFPDLLLPVAGGYLFTEPDIAVQLDGSRSIARQGHEVVSYTWHLHDGSVVRGPTCDTSYSEPGLYAEELRIKADNEVEDRDFALVRVYDPVCVTQGTATLPYGWFHSFPVRGAKPNGKILFCSRLANMAGPVTIDFGDGSSPEDIADDAFHSYSRPGCYTVSLTGVGIDSHPVILKIRVIIEEPGTRIADSDQSPKSCPTRRAI